MALSTFMLVHPSPPAGVVHLAKLYPLKHNSPSSIPPRPWQPPLHFLSPSIWLLWGPDIRGTAQHLSSCGWLTSLRASLVAQLEKSLPAMRETWDSISGFGGSPGRGHGNPLCYSGLENSMTRVIHGVAESRTQLSDFHFHLLLHLPWCPQGSSVVQYEYNFLPL